VQALILSFFVIGLSISVARAQDAVADVRGTDQQEQTQPSKDSTMQKQDQTQKMDMPGMDMPGMDMSQPTPDWMPSPHDASGTGWQPAATAGHFWMKSAGAWDLMAHGVIFVDYNQQGGPRGEGKAESVNWLMLMEQHKLWGVR